MIRRKIVSLGKSALCAVLTAALVATQAIVPVMSFADTSSSPTAFSDLMDVKESKSVSTTNPYGYAQNVWFPLNTEDELMFNYSFGGEYKSANWFDTYKYGGGSPVSSSSYESADTKLPSPSTKFNLIEQIAFDPNGTGHNDHVAFVGMDSQKLVYIWVYDSQSNTLSDPVKVTSYGLSWLGNDDDFFRWANNYVSITVGDFNGNGKDTIVVYGPQPKDETTNRTYLFEYSYSNGTFKKMWSRSMLLNQAALKTDGLNASEGAALCVDLEAADLNGDGCDDLACVSTFARTKNGSSSASVNAYCSELRVAYGDKNVESLNGGIISKCDGSMQLRDEGARNDGKTTFRTMFDAAVSAGDVNNDGYDELVVAGWKTSVVSEEDTLNSTGDIRKGSTNNSIGVMVVCATGGELFAETPYTVIQSNEWTNKGIDDDDSYYPGMQMSCVAINGKVEAEDIFINGTLYDNTFATKLYEHSYFNSKDEGAGGNWINRAFMTSVAVGNFDGNDVGREQVVYSIALKEMSTKDHTALTGILYGTDYDDQTVNGETVHGVARDYDGKHSGYIYENKGASWSNMQNLQLVAFDRDNDGAIARYKYTDTIYADPQVKAVLQAAPYFSELGGYGVFGSGQTTYAISESYSITKGEGNSVSVGIGSAGEVEAVCVRVAVEMGYTGGYSKSWENSYTTTWTDKFSANSRDTVVVSRTPIANYVYDVKAEDENGNLLEQDESLTVSAPGKPSYVQLTIDQYNEFVDEYNAQAEELNNNPTSDFSDELKNKAQITKLNHIDTSDPNSDMKYLGNEGNPWGYRSNWGTDQDSAEQVSKSLYTMNDAGGSITSNYATETGKSVTKTGTFGFEVGVTIQAGGAIEGVGSAWIGGYVNVAYDHEWSTTKSSTNGVETEGIVSNIDTDEAELSPDTTKAYGFQWSFGQWTFDSAVNQKGQTVTVPVVGYALQNIRAASLTPSSLSATATDVDSVELEWDVPTNDNRKRPSIAGFYIYQVVDGDYQLIETVDDPDARSVVLTGLASNTEFEFAVSSYTTEYNYDPYARSDESKIAKATTFKKSFTLSYDATKHGSISVSQLGSVAVGNGESVPEQTLITGSVSAENGYRISGLYITCGEGAEEQLTMTSSGEFHFVLTDDTVIRAETEKLIDQATVSLEQSDGGTIVGYSEGVEFNPSGSTVSQEVTVEAVPDEGMALKSWVVTSSDSVGVLTEEFEALGSNTLSFFISRPSYRIEAVFVSETDPAVTVSLQMAVTGQGDVSVTGNNGRVYEPDTDGNYLISKGDQITVSAVPAANWVLSDWSGDFGSYTKSDKEISLAALTDISAGVVFKAPVKYQVAYSTNTVGVGTVTCDTATSGSNQAKGSDHVIKAEAASGYRLYQWVITQQGQDDQVIPVTDLTTSAEYVIEDLNAHTSVKACFKEIEKYSLNVNAVNCTVTVTRDGEAVNPGNEALLYGDVITIAAQGDEGYAFQKLTVNGEDFKSGSTITVCENITVDASYIEIPKSVPVSEEIKKFDLTVNATNCTVTVTRDGEEVEQGSKVLKRGDEITIVVQGDEDFVFGKLTVNGNDFESGSTFTVSDAVEIDAAYVKIGLASITVPEKVYDYTGKAITPAATVKDANGNTVDASSYELAYSENVKAGEAAVVATGTGVYEGVVTTTFIIEDNVAANTSVMSSRALIGMSNGKVSVRWGKVATATSYEVFIAECGKSFSKKPTKVVNNTTTKLSFSKVLGKKINASKNYKAVVSAYRMDGGEKIYLGSCLTMHVAGSKSGYTNATSLKVAKSATTVSVGKTVSMPKVTTVKTNANKKLLPTTHGARLRYYSSDTKVATISAKGVIEGVSNGTCYVYAKAQNGRTVKVKVTVK